LKSNVSDYLKLMEVVYIDATIKCIADVSDFRDLEVIRSRVEEEGFSFLTITLPRFCQDFERSLGLGYIDSKFFQGFRKNRSIPAFLQGMISQIFDRETGSILNEQNDFPTIIEAVRQICLLFKKVEIECTPERLAAALTSFKETERSFELFSLPEASHSQFLAVSRCLWDNMLVDIDPSRCFPRHGPGATAEGISGNQKYSWQYWNERLEPYFPVLENAYPLGTPLDSWELEKLTIVPRNEETPVRVVFVPKTLKSPRVIAIEPCCVQYTQQGLRDVLYDKMEKYWLTAGHINFRDQSINQRLAISASSTGQLATIDLSDASDRVPHDLAMEMFDGNPDFRDAIESCRSTSARLPNGELIPTLKKFASMGSALCFPVEAMYFYTICIVALLQENGLPVTQRNIFTVSRDVYVYGDDIIVPTTNAMTVLDYLQKYNCKVNVNKTFVSGSFRESCGVDAYSGYEVTPTYIRKLHPENWRQADRIISWCATANLFYKKGYWRTATRLWNIVERLVGRIPYLASRYTDGLEDYESHLEDMSSGLGRISYLGYRSVERWDRKLQQPQVRRWFQAQFIALMNWRDTVP